MPSLAPQLAKVYLAGKEETEADMKKAKVIQDGQTQVVQLPKEFAFEGNEVYINKTGNIVHLIPCNDSWNSLFQSLGKFSDDFMEDRVQPEVQKREAV